MSRWDAGWISNRSCRTSIGIRSLSCRGKCESMLRTFAGCAMGLRTGRMNAKHMHAPSLFGQ